MSKRTLFFGLCFIASAAACGGGDDDGTEEEEVNCAEDTRHEEFVAGMTKAGSVWSFRLMDSLPAPPDKGDNAWTIQIDSGTGGVDDLDVTVTPFMPDHGHGTPIESVISDEGGGAYRADPVNMGMRGVWEITVEAENDTESDSAMFVFCVEG